MSVESERVSRFLAQPVTTNWADSQTTASISSYLRDLLEGYAYLLIHRPNDPLALVPFAAHIELIIAHGLKHPDALRQPPLSDIVFLQNAFVNAANAGQNISFDLARLFSISPILIQLFFAKRSIAANSPFGLFISNSENLTRLLKQYAEQIPENYLREILRQNAKQVEAAAQAPEFNPSWWKNILLSISFLRWLVFDVFGVTKPLPTHIKKFIMDFEVNHELATAAELSPLPIWMTEHNDFVVAQQLVAESELAPLPTWMAEHHDFITAQKLAAESELTPLPAWMTDKLTAAVDPIVQQEINELGRQSVDAEKITDLQLKNPVLFSTPVFGNENGFDAQIGEEGRVAPYSEPEAASMNESHPQLVRDGIHRFARESVDMVPILPHSPLFDAALLDELAFGKTVEPSPLPMPLSSGSTLEVIPEILITTALDKEESASALPSLTALAPAPAINQVEDIGSSHAAAEVAPAIEVQSSKTADPAVRSDRDTAVNLSTQPVDIIPRSPLQQTLTTAELLNELPFFNPESSDAEQSTAQVNSHDTSAVLSPNTSRASIDLTLKAVEHALLEIADYLQSASTDTADSKRSEQHSTPASPSGFNFTSLVQGGAQDQSPASSPSKVIASESPAVDLASLVLNGAHDQSAALSSFKIATSLDPAPDQQQAQEIHSTTVAAAAVPLDHSWLKRLSPAKLAKLRAGRRVQVISLPNSPAQLTNDHNINIESDVVFADRKTKSAPVTPFEQVVPVSSLTLVTPAQDISTVIAHVDLQQEAMAPPEIDIFALLQAGATDTKDAKTPPAMVHSPVDTGRSDVLDKLRAGEIERLLARKDGEFTINAEGYLTRNEAPAEQKDDEIDEQAAWEKIRKSSVLEENDSRISGLIDMPLPVHLVATSESAQIPSPIVAPGHRTTVTQSRETEQATVPGRRSLNPCSLQATPYKQQLKSGGGRRIAPNQENASPNIMRPLTGSVSAPASPQKPKPVSRYPDRMQSAMRPLLVSVATPLRSCGDEARLPHLTGDASPQPFNLLNLINQGATDSPNASPSKPFDLLGLINHGAADSADASPSRETDLMSLITGGAQDPANVASPSKHGSTGLRSTATPTRIIPVIGAS